MKLPKMLRNLIWISAAVFVISLAATAVLSGYYQTGDAALSRLPLPMQVTAILAMISFFLIPGSFIASVLVRSGENAVVREFGASATARVLAIHTTGERDNGIPVMRIKLEVYPPGGTPFQAVAEDAVSYLQIGDVSPAATISVKYDPRTREVALEKAKITKEDDF